MKIAILGSRGIPNRYGGFESCATELSKRLARKGHQVLVYTVAEHPLKDARWNGVARKLVLNPEKFLGSAGQFVYDLLSNMHSRRQAFDIILRLGFTSDAVWHRLWHSTARNLVNMDGLEWRRTKYSKTVRKFLKWSEHKAVERAVYLIADSAAIGKYLEKHYSKPIRYISYGAYIPEAFNADVPGTYNLTAHAYDLMIARMQADNHLETAIRARLMSSAPVPLVIMGDYNKYRKGLENRYADYPEIIFLSPVFDHTITNSLRHYSRYFIHGHSAGGTNPSLLESMACSARLICHDNVFNRAVCGAEADYFFNAAQLAALLESDPVETDWAEKNLEKIRTQYDWDAIADEYEKLFYDAL